MIRAYLEAGESEQAVREAESASQQFKLEPGFHLEVGRFFLRYGLIEQARVSLERANRLAPHEPEIVFPPAEAYLLEKDTSAALVTLQSSQPEAKNLVVYHYLLAQSYYQDGRAQEAVDEINLASRLDSRNPIYLLTAGRYYQKYGRQQEALNMFEKAEVQAPNLAEIP